MNKISKKIVALATMAAFVLTLVPAAAFAAPVKDTSYTVSKATQTDFNKTTVNITLSDADYASLSANSQENVVVWAEDAQGNNVAYSQYSNAKNATLSDWTSETAALLSTPTAQNISVDITFATQGTYNIYVAVNDGDSGFYGNLTDAEKDVVKVGGSAFTAFTTRYADREASSYGVFDAKGDIVSPVDANAGDETTTTFKILGKDGQPTNDGLDNVRIYVIDNETKDVTTLGTVTVVDADGKVLQTLTPGANGGYPLSNVTNNTLVNVKFDVKGSYTVFAGEGTSVEDAQKNPLKGATTINVKDESVIDHFSVKAVAKNISNNKTNDFGTLKFDENNMATIDLTEFKDFRFNGQDTITLSGVAYEENGDAAQYQTVNFDVTTNGTVEFTKDTDNTDVDGTFDTAFTMQNKTNVIVTITDPATKVEYSIRVIADKAVPDDINRTLTGGYVLAGNDDNWSDSNRWFTDAVQFEILDSKDDVVTSFLTKDAYVITVQNRATGSDLTADELALVPTGDGAYTLVYTGTTPEKDLVPGKYEVRVSLTTNDTDNATVTFTAEKFGKAQDTVLDVYAADHNWSWGNPNKEIMTVDDQITLGQTVGVVAQYVDENGIKIKADDVTYGFNGGLAVVDPMPKDGFFSTPADIPANQSLLGTEIEIVAYNTAKHQLVTKTLTVVPSYTDKSLEFDPVQGPTNEDNKVTVSVVDENGKVQQVEGTLDAWVADQSNEDAKISVKAAEGRHAVQNGKGTLTVYSDQETTADITVVVKAGNESYYGTLEYTFGAEDPLANRTVVMTIDSTEYVVNNKVFTGDAAPYVDSNWRTMVPIRALMEAFDAEVVWDEANPDVVTINYDGDTQIVMNVGETGYTIDGEEGEMDTVPVNNNGRVYVPIRFVAEGIGFHVTPLYNADGLTASVVFQR